MTYEIIVEYLIFIPQDQFLEHFLESFPTKGDTNFFSCKKIKIKKIQKILGVILLRHMLEKYELIKKPYNLLKIKKTKNGKPYIDNTFNFNISHSNTVVATALYLPDKISHIGIDIEIMIIRDFVNMADLFFSIDEIKYLKKNRYDIHVYYEIWTKKESYSKYKGLAFNKKYCTIKAKNVIFFTYFIKNLCISCCVKKQLDINVSYRQLDFKTFIESQIEMANVHT